MSRNQHTFQKGNKVGLGNTNARRRDFLTQQMISRLNDTIKSGKHRGKPRYALLIEQAIAAAERGEGSAIDRVFDRVEGRPRQSVEITGDERNPVQTVQRVVVKPDGKS